MSESEIVAEAQPRRVVVTGARGFLGRPCVAALVEGGWEVHAVTSDPGVAVTGRPGGPGSGEDGVRWHAADLLQPEEAAIVLDEVRPSHLLHVAWAPNRGIYDSLENFPWVRASLELLEAFAAVGGRRAVFAGSCAEYAPAAPQPLSEESPLGGTTAYGAAKRSLFQLFTDYTRLAGISGAWARLFFLYGPGEVPERLVPAVITALLHGEPARCTHGEQVRDYLYSLDAADALVRLLESDAEGPMNVASGEGTRLKDLIEEIGRQLGGTELIELGAIPAREGEAAEIVGNVERLRRELEWRPRHDPRRGVEDTIAWWARRLTH